MLAVHFEERTVPGFAQNLSGRGIFFYAETALPEGAVVEFRFSPCPRKSLWGKTCRFGVVGGCCALLWSFPGGSANRDRRALDSYQYLPSDEPISQFVRVSVASAAREISGPIPREARASRLVMCSTIGISFLSRML